MTIFTGCGNRINVHKHLALLEVCILDGSFAAMGRKFDPNLLRSYMMGAADPVRGSKTNTSMFGEEIDLHVDSRQFSGGKRDNKYAIEFQIDALEAALDNAITKGKVELRIIHGIGKGKLKDEVHRILARHPHVKSYENSYHARYGWGSTIVQFK
jgi:hypothetical protein